MLDAREDPLCRDQPATNSMTTTRETAVVTSPDSEADHAPTCRMPGWASSCCDMGEGEPPPSAGR